MFKIHILSKGEITRVYPNVVAKLFNQSVHLSMLVQWAFWDSTLSMFCRILSVFFLSCRWRCSNVRISITSTVCVGVGDVFACRLFPEAPGLICADTSYELYWFGLAFTCGLGTFFAYSKALNYQKVNEHYI